MAVGGADVDLEAGGDGCLIPNKPVRLHSAVRGHRTSRQTVVVYLLRDASGCDYLLLHHEILRAVTPRNQREATQTFPVIAHVVAAEVAESLGGVGQTEELGRGDRYHIHITRLGFVQHLFAFILLSQLLRDVPVVLNDCLHFGVHRDEG